MMNTPLDKHAASLMAALKDNSRTDRTSLKIHLWALENIQAVKEDGVNLEELCLAAGLNKSWRTEMHKMRAIAPHVTMK